VVAGKFATRRFEQDHLGITHDTLLRGANADLYASLDGFRPEQDAVFRRQMRAVYDRFVAHVAAGRGLDPAAVESAARGRIWTGEDALRLGLIDELGGIERAIELAREAAGLDEPVRITFHPEPADFFDQLFGRRVADLPGALRAVLRAASDRRPGMLELGADAAALAAPF
jgi:protease-4